MRYVIRRVTVGMATVGLAAGMLGLMPGTASAAANPTQNCHRKASCDLLINNFPGGTLTVDYDVVGDPAMNTDGHWGVIPIQLNEAVCFGDFKANDPKGSYECSDIPPGPVMIRATGGYFGETRIGARF